MIAATWPFAPKYFSNMEEVFAFAKEKNHPIHVKIILRNKADKLIKVWPNRRTQTLEVMLEAKES